MFFGILKRIHTINKVVLFLNWLKKNLLKLKLTICVLTLAVTVLFHISK